MQTDTLRLTPFTAVFNGHVNNADSRARDFLAKMECGFLEEVEEVEREGEGIMAIFGRPPTAATGAYVALVTLFANETPGSTE